MKHNGDDKPEVVKKSGTPRMCSVRTFCDLPGTGTGPLLIIVPEVCGVEFVG